MDLNFSFQLFIFVIAALTGGFIFRLFKLQPMIGYLLGGVVFRIFFPLGGFGIETISQLGIILLLFSVGLEIPLHRLAKVIRTSLLAVVIQILLTMTIFYLILIAVGLDSLIAVILAFCFSLSSTAVIVKMLSEKGETDTIHGELMTSWSLLQDLMTIPVLVIVAAFVGEVAGSGGGAYLFIFKSFIVIAVIIVSARFLAPKILHKVASLNSRELLILTAVALALGIAGLTSSLGLSPALGAFLAGVVISQSQENLAVFAETRPLRDLFVAVFFVSLGFLVTPGVIYSKILLIITLAVFVIVIKFIVTMILTIVFGYHGKTSVAVSLGMAQIGEFSFILLSMAESKKLITNSTSSLGIATALVTLIASPILYRSVTPLWRLIKKKTEFLPGVSKIFVGWDKSNMIINQELKNHIVICGYGRVGSWVGKALETLSIPFIVVEYNQAITNELRAKGTPVIYGDPTEREVLEAANISDAKLLVLAVPDETTREGIITLSQTIAPDLRIISRVHTDSDWEKLRIMKVDRIIQPEFEAAVTIIRLMLVSMGRPKEEIAAKIKSLRQSRALTK